jgi:hypothetical protein
MTDQATSGGSGTPATPPSDSIAPSSFVRQRVSQMTARQAQQPAPAATEPAAQPQQPPPQQQQQTKQNVSQRHASIREDEWDATVGRPNEKFYERFSNDSARLAEYDVHKNSLPTKYEARLPPDFVLPPGAPRVQFDEANPALAQARQIAHAEGMSQQGFEKLLGVFASTQIPGQMQQQTQLARLREANMAQLGVTANLRVDAVATWLQARVGGVEGKAMADTLRQYPAAQFVKGYETLIKQISNSQRAAELRRENESANADTRIPGYDKMSYVQRRVWQMAQMMNKPGYRGG